MEKTQAPADFKKMEVETEARGESILGMHDSLSSMVKAIEKGSSLSKLGKLIIMQGKLYGTEGMQLEGTQEDASSKSTEQSDAAISSQIIEIGSMTEQIGRLQSDFAAKIRSGLLAHLGKMTEEMKEWDRIRKKLANRRLDFDAKQNKLAKKDNPKPDLVAEVEEAKSKYEETIIDAEKVMSALKEQEHGLYEAIVSFASSHAEYLKDASAVSLSFLGSSAMPTASLKTETTPPVKKSSVPNMQPAKVQSTTSSSQPVQKEESPPAYEAQAKASPPHSQSKAIKLNIERVRAMHAFNAQSDDELSLEKGDVVTVMKKIDEGWWIGVLNGRTGMFPANYVESTSQEKSAQRKPIAKGIRQFRD